MKKILVAFVIFLLLPSITAFAGLANKADDPLAVIALFNQGFVSDQVSSELRDLYYALNFRDADKIGDLGLVEISSFIKEYYKEDVLLITSSAYPSLHGVFLAVECVSIKFVSEREANIVSTSILVPICQAEIVTDPDKDKTVIELREVYPHDYWRCLPGENDGVFRQSGVVMGIMQEVYNLQKGVNFQGHTVREGNDLEKMRQVLSPAADLFGDHNGLVTPYEIFSLRENLVEALKIPEVRDLLVSGAFASEVIRQK